MAMQLVADRGAIANWVSAAEWQSGWTHPKTNMKEAWNKS